MKQKRKNPLAISKDYCPEGMPEELWQRRLRVLAGHKGSFSIAPLAGHWSGSAYKVGSPRSRRQYTVVFHGPSHPFNSCECMDFRTNNLCTCKHIEAVSQWRNERHVENRTTLPPFSVLDVSYRRGRRLRLRRATNSPEELTIAAMRFFDDDFYAIESRIHELPAFIEAAKRLEPSFHCTSDALNLILEERDRLRRQEIARTLTDEEIASAINTRLYPYQMEGVRFAFNAGRCLIADEMGLGKTVQAIAASRLLLKKHLVGSVLIVCPTSLKYQWKKEIERFTDAEVTVIEGAHTKRRELYADPTAYKIVSYHTLANDIKAIGTLQVDMLIMDEVQRLKNWNTQISQAARRVESDYAVILSGTPLENKVEELYSIMQFVDQYALGPYHEFMSHTVVTNESGKVIGYRGLNEIGKKLEGYMLRRRKADVALQLPERTDKILYVPMTKEQRAIHDEAMNGVAQLVSRWQRTRFLSEKDRKRLLLLLSQMRMVCDSTYILDLTTHYDTKVAETVQLIIALMENGNEKAVVFSQWERMTRLICQELENEGIAYEYLNGSVPSQQRGKICNSFNENPDVRVFISTDAGCTGLNLQSASIIINLDLPWNPAILEQRIARLHRIGQKRNIQVINLVAAGTIEERMLTTLNFKQNLFEGILDGGEDRITLDDNKLAKMAEGVSRMLENNSDPATIDGTLVASTDTETPAEQNPTAEESLPSTGEDTKTNIQKVPDARELIGNGLKFLGDLALTLKSEEATKQLIDNLVHTNKDTGYTELRIPVESKESVEAIINAFRGLFK